MIEIIFLVEEAAEGGFNARALNEPVITQAETVDALRQAVRDAVRCHFDEADLPRVMRLHFVRPHPIGSDNLSFTRKPPQTRRFPKPRATTRHQY